jgi:release factor glutamine methyltransferase
VSPAPDGTVTWRELLGETADRLRAAGLPAAESEARRMVAEASGSTDDVALILSTLATDRGVARLDDMVSRRSAGEPLQYVLGSWGFRSLDLMVDRRVLIPRPETETVVEVALAELDQIGGREVSTRVADLGTGSGAIALSIAVERARTEVWATEVDADSATVAMANLAGAGRAARRVTLVVGSWFDALPEEFRGGFQLIVSNPPYVPSGADLPAEVADWEPAGALFAGEDGTDALRELITGAGEWLVEEGVLVCELSPEQASAVAELAAEHFSAVRVEADLTGRDRCLVARRPRRAGG